MERNRLVPWDCEYRSPSAGVEPIHSQYWLTPVPLVHLKVTVDEGRLDPGTGDVICARGLDPLGVFVAVGVSTVVAVAVSVGVRDGPAVGVGVAVAVRLAVGTAVEP